jgi:plastocyanin
MAKFSRLAGATGQSVTIFIQDSSSTTGAGKTGLVAANLSLYYTFTGTNAGSVVQALSDLAAVNSAFSAGGIKEIDSTNMKGMYRFDLPNAALAAGKGNTVAFMIQDSGAHNVTPTPFEIELTGVDNQDGVRMGMTALPNAAAAGAGGLGTVDATNSIKIQGAVKRNTALNNFPFVMLNTAGSPQTGLAVTATRSIDGAAFGPCANLVTELANGWYLINLANTDLNGTNIAFRFIAAAARDTDVLLVTYP